MDKNQKRKAIATFIVSAIAIAGIQMREGFTDHAIIPIPGDVPTYGYGSTIKANGSKVTLQDKITRADANKLLVDTVNKTYAEGVVRCAPDLQIYQHEFDFLVDSAYNLGVNRVCNSSMVQKFRRGDYAGGCAAIRLYKYAAGKDCTVPVNRCGGIPKDRERAYKMCMWGDYGVPSREEATIAAKRMQEPKLPN